MATLMNWTAEPSSGATLSEGPSDSVPESKGSLSLFGKEIKFHLETKPFTGFCSGGGGFRLETLNPKSSSEPQRPAGISLSGTVRKRADGSEVLDNGLDPELSFGITFRRIGAGLQNLGNTCFLNSVLQCLTYTEPLAAYLQSGKHKTSCRTSGFCALCAIQNHVSRALQSTGRILAPKDLVSNLRCISRSFRNSRQEDAHEYMVNLLESMHKCCLPSGVPSESPSAYDKSLVHKIFGGRLRSQVKCMQCSFCSNKYDPFLDLSLEIVRADSLYKALAHFTAKEQLDGGEKQYQCQHCKQKVKALKQLTVDKAPYVLTIHLKRFGSHIQGQKIDKKIQFGPTLDLKPFVSGGSEGDLKYTLYGVLVHAGWSTHSGHYYCFVRTSSGMWYSLDDNQVVQVSERKVLEQKAYMLFYVRDRKPIVSKKAVDIVQKEKITVIDRGNKVYSDSKVALKETIRKIPIDERKNNPHSYASLPKEVLKNEAFDRDIGRESSANEPPLKDSMNGPSVSNSNLPQLASCDKGSDESFKLENGESAVPAAKIVESNVGDFAHKDRNDSAVVPANCNGSQSSDTKKDLRDKIIIPLSCNANKCGISEVVPSANSNGLHKSTGTACSTEKMSSVKVGDLSMESAIDSVGTDNLGQRTQAPEDKPPLTKTKKLSKGQIISMCLGSNILLGTTLSLKKKKKHKKRKLYSLGLKNLNQETTSDDLGPSTSEKIKKMNFGAASHSQRKRETENIIVDVKNVTISSNEWGTAIVNEEFRGSVDKSGTVLAADKILHKGCGSVSASKQLDPGRSNISTNGARDAMQNCLMSMLTRGLEETAVARWDDIELPSSAIIDSSVNESIRIGYIADEWDEEYDRGKRKKVRSFKHEFGGPNPFQEIASKKAKLKPTKKDHSSSGNHPLRI